MTAVAEYYTIHRIPQRFNPGIVVASVAVAALGSYSTLLVLGKRTSNKGLKNILLLSLAATTMASVGIWGMHFIGMHMSLRPIGGVSWYIKVNPGFTVLSLFVPIVALHVAFFIVDSQVAFSIVRTACSGILVGLIVSLMHYSASLKTNFAVIYSPALVTVSIVVACVAATVALVAFFKFRAQWEDSWWKRLLCAAILAGGVSGMHYIGVWGTSYKVKPQEIDTASLLSGRNRNNVLVIAIACMCFVIVVFSTFIAVSDLLVVRDARRKAKKVVVCSATFDKQGRLLVKPDGTMPLMIIETDVNIRDILEALDNRQPTFQWLYSLSWDWHIITPWLKAITARFVAESENSQRREAEWKRRGKKMIASGRRSLDLNEDRRRGPQSLADFRDRFVDAANHLAAELDIPFEEIGVLYDHVLPTGTRGNDSLGVANDTFSPSRKHYADDESSINGPVPSIFGDGDSQEEGAMLFLVRELPGSSQSSTERFRQMGYRMTETRFLAGVLADRVAVKKEEMEPLLESLKVYAKRGTRPVVQPGGVYAGLFGVRASTSKEGGLDVLVYNFARHQIPAYRLPDVHCITPEMKTFLATLDQATMEDAMKICERESIRSGERRKYLQSMSSVNVGRNGEMEMEQESIELMIQFQTALFIALDALHNSVRFYPKICQTARISAEVLEVPSSLDDSTPPAEMILVQAVLPEERSLSTPYSGSHHGHPMMADVVPTDKPNSATPFVFIPYTLFSKSQMMLLRGRQADDFEHEVIIEMRRRYPSSLQHEIEEKAGMESYVRHHDSMMYNKSSANLSDDVASHSSHEKDMGAQISSRLPTVRRWASKLSNDHGRRLSRDENMYESSVYERSTVVADTRDGHRVSTNSSRSKPEEAEVRAVAVLRQDDPRPTSAGSSAHGNGNGNSLGIRRFIAENGNGYVSSSAGRFVHPADEAIVEETATTRSEDDKMQGEPMIAPPLPPMPASPPTAAAAAAADAVFRPRARPSTAPAGGRREAALQRPFSAHGTRNPVTSQRQRQTANQPQDETSLMARLHSDGWYTRQIQSLERSPAGTALLGVDF